MKALKYIFAVLLTASILSANAYAQSQTVYSGYVFIDGKYIEPPYKIERKGFSIYINDIETMKYKKPKSDTTKYEYPGYPPNITKNSSFKEMLVKHPKYNTSYISVARGYYSRKYKNNKIVRKKLIKYIRGFPNVKSYNGYNLETYNGDKINYYLLFPHRYNQNELKKILDRTTEGIKSLLKSKHVLIFFTGIHNYKMKTKEFICSILYLHNKKNKTSDEIIDYLIKNKLTINGERKWIKSFLNDLDYNINICNENDFKEKIEKSQKNTGSIYNKSIKDAYGNSYSPLNHYIVTGCSSTYDFEAFSTYPEERNVVTEQLSLLGYNFIGEFTDDNFDDVGDYCYDDLVNMRHNSVIYWTSHGLERTYDNDGGIVIMQMQSESALDAWLNNSSGEGIQYIRKAVANETTQQEIWLAVATKDWFQNVWGPYTEANKSLIFLSCCFSYQNSCAQACVLNSNYGEKGVAFGYRDSTYGDNDLVMTEGILKRMNGTEGNGQYRTAKDAYNHLPTYYDQFSIYPQNADFTLCPAIKQVFPQPNSTNPTSGTGYIEFDTWCYAPSADASDAVSFDFTVGSGQVTNIQWVDIQNNASHKISFDWQGQGTLTITFHPENIVSYPNDGTGHLLDPDGIAPNGESYSYKFYCSQQSDLSANFYASSTNINAGQSVNFYDQSGGSPNSWHWTFEGGSPSTSTEQNPTGITYDTEGDYNVTLEVTDSYGNSNTLTKNNYIHVSSGEGTTVTISGTVENNNYQPIAGATVSADNGGGYGYTDNNGDFSIEVPYGWSGTVTASAPGYQSAHLSYDNLIQDVTNANFMLNSMTDFNFTWTSSGLNAQFTPHGINIGCDCFWDYGDGDTELVATSIGNTWHHYTAEGTYYVCLQQVCDGVYSERHCQYITVSQPPPPPSGEDCPVDFDLPCNVIEQGTSLYLFDNSPLNIDPTSCIQEGRNYFKQWNFKENDALIQDSSKKYITTTYPGYSIYHQFNYTRKSYITLTFGYDDNNEPATVSQQTKILAVINCNDIAVPETNHFFGGLFDYIFSDEAVSNTNYAFNTDPHLFAGSFRFDGRMNDFLNFTDRRLSACREIVIDGDQEFIADGTHELVLDIIHNDCINNGSSYMPPTNYASHNASDFTTKNFQSGNSIKCYPNPFTDKANLVIVVNQEDNYKITLYDIFGRKIKDLTDEKLKEGIYNIIYNFSSLQTGIYLLQIQTSQGINTIKIEKVP